MTATAPSTPQSAMVRPLLVAIAIMTLAIVFLFGAIVARLLSPRVEGVAQSTIDSGTIDLGTIDLGTIDLGTIDFAAAPEVEIGLPPGVRVVESHVSAERATFVIETLDGERGVYTTPLTGFDQPVRLVFHTLE
jgi:hypothetical protein